MTPSSIVESTAPPVQPPVHNGKGGWWQVASAWIPVVLCVLVISQESTIYFGADHTSGPLQHFFEFFFGPFTQPEWWRWHIVIRKSGHFLGYGILSISWFRAFWMTVRRSAPLSRSRAAIHCFTMLGTLAVAACDEVHQTFLPNRSGSVRDVLVDCSGALIMQLLIWIWMRRRFSV